MSNQQLFADDPISSKKDDVLERDGFAKQVADVCNNVSKESNSSVIALVGAWGSGKSSLLSLVKNQLSAEKWTVAEFNPWIFSDVEGLVINFFTEIAGSLPDELKDKQGLKDLIAHYGRYVAPLGNLTSLVGISGGDKMIKAGLDFLSPDKSVSKQKKELEEKLSKLKKPILVILDDLDRLHPDELLLIFKLVRLVGRLPNIHYLLSYDEETLLDVIEETGLAKGKRSRAKSYLEKIVQVRLDLPTLTPTQQGSLTDEGLEEVLVRNGITLDDEDTMLLGSAYQDCMKLYLNQPRAIKRYFAQIEALYPLVKEEVYFPDFTLLTFLRTFEPEVYKLIVNSRAELVGNEGFTMQETTNAERKANWQKKLEGIAEHPEEIFELLALLFLTIKQARNNANYGPITADGYQRRQRVSAEDYFDRYFVFGVPSSDFPDSSVRKALATLAEGKKSKELTDLISFLRRDPSLVIRKMFALDEAGNLPLEATITLIANNYNDFPEKPRMFALSPKLRAQALVSQLIDKLDAKKLSETVSTVLSDLPGLQLIVDASYSAEREKDKWYEATKPIISKAYLEFMNKAGSKALDKLSDAELGFISAYPHLVGETECKKWIWNQVDKKGWDLLNLLIRVQPEANVYGDGPVRRVVSELSRESLDKVFGEKEIVKRLKPELDKFKEDTSLSLRGLEPTKENKKKYLLTVFKAIQREQDKPQPPMVTA